MPIKPDITNASEALWSAAVERERVIATLVAAPQVSRSEVEEAAQELELSRRPSSGLRISCEIYSLTENDRTLRNWGAMAVSASSK